MGWAAGWEQDFDCCRRKPLDLTKETWTESPGLAGRTGTRGSVSACKEAFKGDSFNRLGALSAIKLSSFYSPSGSTQMQAPGLRGQGWRWARSLTLLQQHTSGQGAGGLLKGGSFAAWLMGPSPGSGFHGQGSCWDRWP